MSVHTLQVPIEVGGLWLGLEIAVVGEERRLAPMCPLGCGGSAVR